MATWQDGPEYAPRERPQAFVEPPAAPLDVPEPPADLSAGAPAELPAFDSPEEPVPDLATLIPAAAVPGRDPRLAFEVVTTMMAPPSPLATPTAWASAHSGGRPGAPGEPAWSPQQPLSAHSTPFTGSIAQQRSIQPGAQVNPSQFPAPGTPQWFAPPDPDERYQSPPQVGVGAVWRAVTPGVVITLGLGILLNPLSILLLGIAAGLATRIQYRRRQVRVSFAVAGGLVGVAWLWNLLANDFYFDWAWEGASGVAQVACAGLILALGLIVALALTRGEKPETRP